MNNATKHGTDAAAESAPAIPAVHTDDFLITLQVTNQNVI